MQFVHIRDVARCYFKFQLKELFAPITLGMSFEWGREQIVEHKNVMLRNVWCGALPGNPGVQEVPAKTSSDGVQQICLTATVWTYENRYVSVNQQIGWF